MKTVIFDLYGTLADIRTDESQPLLWNKLALFMAGRKAIYTPEELQAAYKKAVQAATKDMKNLSADSHEGNPEIDILKVFQSLYEAKGVSADETLLKETAHLFRVLSTLYVQTYPHARDLLDRLKEDGKQVILLSNAQSEFTRPELAALDIEDAFDAIYISSDYGCKKPDPAFFEICLKEQNINPQEAIMIGNDGSCDIGGAKAVGLPTFYIRSNISPKEELPNADLVLDHMDLQEVFHMLKEYEKKQEA